MQKNSLKYPVKFVDDLFGADDSFAKFIGARKFLLVADQNVVQHTPGLGSKIGAYVKAHSLSLVGAPVVLAGGERIKIDQGQSAMKIADAALSAKLSTDDLIVALGGGAMLDVAGWVASQFKGGLGLVRVPTTPAAALGGVYAETAALDTLTAKNALVVPSLPSAVFVSLALATGVLDGVWRAGFSEVVRLFAAHDAKNLEKKLLPIAKTYATRDFGAFREAAECAFALWTKKGETDFARNAAAELEVKSNWKLPSGYAVAIGVLLALRGSASFEAARLVLKTSGALEGLHYSRHILPPEIANF